MSDKPLTIAQIYDQGKENIKSRGETWAYPASGMGPSVRANRKYLESLFLEPRFFDPVEPDTGCSLFGIKLKSPVFCSAISRPLYIKDNTLMGDIAAGIARSGSLMMLGIGGSAELQSAIDAGASVIKMIKPYRNTDLIYEKLKDAETRGCVAVGMDIDHFHGIQRIDGEILRTELYAPQKTAEIRQLISQTKLPFIIKGVLSTTDAEKAIQLGASAILVSNHASGSFNYGTPSLIALPKIAEKFGDKITVLVDTGFESGNDVLKGLALGAKAVGMGTGMILAWALNKAEGVEMLLEVINSELRRSMAITGCPDIQRTDRSILVQMPYTL